MKNKNKEYWEKRQLAREELSFNKGTKAYREYVKILNELLNNNNVKNIALSGPHGSGKSSIINTYLAKYPKTKAIKLSLANFAGKEEGGVDDKVELKLLEQFFYKVDSAKIPQSRYRKIKKKY